MCILASQSLAPPPPVGGLGPLLNTKNSGTLYYRDPHFSFFPPSNTIFTPQPSQCLSLLHRTLLFRSALSRTPSASLMSTAPSPPRVWYVKAQSTPDILQTADNSSGCFPRDSCRPPETSLKVRRRFRRRFRLRQATGAAGQARWPARHRSLRLLLLRERPHCLQARRAARLKHLHQVHW